MANLAALTVVLSQTVTTDTSRGLNQHHFEVSSRERILNGLQLAIEAYAKVLSAKSGAHDQIVLELEVDGQTST